MSRNTKIWTGLGFLLIAFGLIIFLAVMISNGFDLSLLSTEKYVTNVHEIEQGFNDILIKTSTADIIFEAATDDVGKITCFENENEIHSVFIEDGKLTIELNDERKWYEQIGIVSKTPKIILSLPAGQYNDLTIDESTGDILIPSDFQFKHERIRTSTGDVANYASAEHMINIKTSTGDIRIKKVQTISLMLYVSTGSIDVSEVKCKEFESDGSTGELDLKNVVATEKITINRSTGDISFDSIDAPDIVITTDTGEVRGHLLSGKIFDVTSGTGKIKIPDSTGNEKCKIHTSTGDIVVKVG